MNDEQCEYLGKVIKELTDVISITNSDIVDAINAIPCASNERIEKLLENLIYVIQDLSCKEGHL